MVQLFKLNDMLVVLSTAKDKPGVLLNWNGNPLLATVWAFVRIIGVADHTLRPGKSASEVGEFKPDAKTEPVPSGLNV